MKLKKIIKKLRSLTILCVLWSCLFWAGLVPIDIVTIEKIDREITAFKLIDHEGAIALENKLSSKRIFIVKNTLAGKWMQSRIQFAFDESVSGIPILAIDTYLPLKKIEKSYLDLGI